MSSSDAICESFIGVMESCENLSFHSLKIQFLALTDAEESIKHDLKPQKPEEK